MHVIEITHETATGHRIPNHEGGRGKCARLHGHLYQYLVQLSSEVLDGTGFVADFGRIKGVLDRWDHRMLLWEEDDIARLDDDDKEEALGVIRVPFVPTSENMAKYLAELFVTEFEVVFAQVDVRESPKTAARYYCSEADVLRAITDETGEWPRKR